MTETKNAAKSIDLEIESAPPPASTSAPAEHVRVKDDFYEGAEDLRETFDEHFDEPRQAPAMRFVWDYWFVPGQYTRTAPRPPTLTLPPLTRSPRR